MKSETVKKRSTPALPWLAIVFLLLISFIMSAKLSSAAALSGDTSDSFADAVMRGARVAMGHTLTKRADTYFHRGITQHRERSFENRFFQRMSQQIEPNGHLHLEGAVTTETLPWYWLAIKMDPHNIEAYMIAAFWLSSSSGAHKEAHEIIMEARRNTDLHFELEFEDAKIFFKEGNLKDAESCIDTGLKIWPSSYEPDSEAAVIGKIHLLMTKAFLREIHGDIDGSVKHLKDLLALTPDDTVLLNRITTLAEGRKPSTLARSYLDAMLQRSGRVCQDEDDDHDHEHDH